MVLHTSCVNYPSEILRSVAQLPIPWIISESVYYELRLLSDSVHFGAAARLILERVRRSIWKNVRYLRKDWDLEQFYECCREPVSPEGICTGTWLFWFGDLNKQDEFLWNVRWMPKQYILALKDWKCSACDNRVFPVNERRKTRVRCSQPLSPGFVVNRSDLKLRDHPGAKRFSGSELEPTGKAGNYADICTSGRYPGKLVKVYQNRAYDGNHVRKLMQLERLWEIWQPQNLALPEKLLYVREDTVAGYTMQVCDGRPIRHYMRLAWKGQDLKKVFRSLLLLLLELHTQRILVNDLSFNNVLVDENGAVSLVDCDSFQVFHFPGGGITDIYRHPTIPPGCERFELRDPRHEYFALAVLLFQCLFCGDPLLQYQGRSDDRQLNWNNARFPLDIADGGLNLPKPNAEILRAWNRQPKHLQKLFADEFHFRRDHSIGSWIKYLDLL